jgi:hypothetical protein
MFEPLGTPLVKVISIHEQGTIFMADPSQTNHPITQSPMSKAVTTAFVKHRDCRQDFRLQSLKI